MNTSKSPTFISKIRRRLKGNPVDLRESLKGVIAEHEKQEGTSSLPNEARSMMQNLLGFSDLRVDDLMVPRANIVAEEEQATMRNLLSQFVEANHSRLPIYRESLDDIVGMIHVKDYLSWMASKGTKRKTKAAVESGISLAGSELSSTIKQHPSMMFFLCPLPCPHLIY
jgi:CBS domain containing-hemolysin-like protein